MNSFLRFPEFVDAHAHYIAPLKFHAGFFQEHKERIAEARRKKIPVDIRLERWFRKTMGDGADMEAGFRCLLDDMLEAEVDIAVLASTSPEEDDAIFKVTRETANIYGLFWVDIRNPKASVEKFLKARADNPKILGMKSTLQYLEVFPDDERLNPLYEKLNNLQLPVQHHVGAPDAYSDLEHYARLAERFPDMSIILLHAGGARWRDIPGLLESHPNIFVEFEALQLHELDRHLPETLLFLLENCQTDRLMFGSDWIWSDEKYFQRVKVVKKLPEPVRRNIACANAMRVLNIPVPNPQRRVHG